jgi:glycosyltransferase involved in cell wall biosynthesis
MRNICLVTNHNYAKYLEACFASLVSQSQRFDQIIIVDDGSSDDSREIIDRFCHDCNYAVGINRKNGGQLSCFNAAVEYIEVDDHIFFMDSDDILPHDYLEQILPFITNEKVDFAFVNSVPFKDGERPLQSACIAPAKTFTFSSTSALTRMVRSYIGAPTSCICMKGSLCHALLPYPFEEDWITRADDVLIYGASIIGAHKLYVESLGISYRIHSANNFTGRNISPNECADWRLRHERLFTWYSRKTGVPQRALLKNALHEAVLIPQTIRKRFAIPSPVVIFLFDFVVLTSIIKLLLKVMCGSRRT